MAEEQEHKGGRKRVYALRSEQDKLIEDVNKRMEGFEALVESHGAGMIQFEIKKNAKGTPRGITWKCVPCEVEIVTTSIAIPSGMICNHCGRPMSKCRGS